MLAQAAPLEFDRGALFTSASVSRLPTESREP